MKKIKLLLVLPLSLIIIGCGTTDKSNEINPNNGFDMWKYMTSPLSYKVEYAFYENGKEIDYYIETNQLFDKGSTYERRSDTGRTTLYLNSNYIVMKEPSRDVEINRYVHLDDTHIFRSSDIDNCTVENFYNSYTIYNSTFKNVLMITCISKNGAKQKLYYGYSEGIVAIYQNNNSFIKEYVKVGETAIF
jgi:NDP-sugar pyrophosphorylase family protein